MTRSKGSGSSADSRGPQATPARVSVQAMYASAMKEVMADPSKAIAEHDPGLAMLQTLIRSATSRG